MNVGGLRPTVGVNGSALITDPETGDAVRLTGLITVALKAHPKHLVPLG